MNSADELKLSKTDRLGLAYCRLNSWKWDDIVGPKPAGFDDMPNTVPGKPDDPGAKYYYVSPAIRGIESIIGEANASRCHFLFNLGKTEEEWLRWYCSPDR